MSWRDRPYSGSDPNTYAGGGVGWGSLKPTPGVLAIISICLVVFAITSYRWSPAQLAFECGALMLPPAKPLWQVWRYVTYQYLHADIIHIFGNILGVFFFGPTLERTWGSLRFLVFYTMCGVVAGLAFAVMQMLFAPGLLFGASGSVLGCIGAVAVLFPRNVVWLFVFPMPIRVFAGMVALMYTLTILSQRDLSDTAHLGGMAAGVAWACSPRRWLGLPWRRRGRRGAWARKMQALQADEEKVDRILDKIRRHGMQSLTWWEKRFLHKASQRRRRFDEQQSRR